MFSFADFTQIFIDDNYYWELVDKNYKIRIEPMFGSVYLRIEKTENQESQQVTLIKNIPNSQKAVKIASWILEIIE